MAVTPSNWTGPPRCGLEARRAVGRASEPRHGTTLTRDGKRTLMLGAHRGAMPIVARLAGPDAIAASVTATDASIGGASSPGDLLPSGDRDRTRTGPGAASDACAGCPPGHFARSATTLATPTLGGSRRSRGRSISSAASSRRSAAGVASPRRSSARRSSRRGSSTRSAASRATCRAVRVAYALRWLELGDGVLRPGWTGLVTGRG